MAEQSVQRERHRYIMLLHGGARVCFNGARCRVGHTHTSSLPEPSFPFSPIITIINHPRHIGPTEGAEEKALCCCSSVQNTAPAEQRHQPLCARVASRWTLQSRRVQGAVNTAEQTTSRRDDDSLCQLVQPFPLPRPYVHWLWRIDGLP